MQRLKWLILALPLFLFISACGGEFIVEEDYPLIEGDYRLVFDDCPPLFDDAIFISQSYGDLTIYSQIDPDIEPSYGRINFNADLSMDSLIYVDGARVRCDGFYSFGRIRLDCPLPAGDLCRVEFEAE